jgi:hypothetical protein
LYKEIVLFSCTVFVYTNTPLFLPESVKINCFDRFFLTVASVIAKTKSRKRPGNPARLHEKIAFRLASPVNAKPFGCCAALTAPTFPLEKSPPSGRETPCSEEGREVTLLSVVVVFPC